MIHPSKNKKSKKAVQLRGINVSPHISHLSSAFGIGICTYEVHHFSCYEQFESRKWTLTTCLCITGWALLLTNNICRSWLSKISWRSSLPLFIAISWYQNFIGQEVSVYDAFIRIGLASLIVIRIRYDRIFIRYFIIRTICKKKLDLENQFRKFRTFIRPNGERRMLLMKISKMAAGIVTYEI